MMPKKIKVNLDIDENILFARLFKLANEHSKGNFDAIDKIESTIEEGIEHKDSSYRYSSTVK
jgi:hypothetical protein